MTPIETPNYHKQSADMQRKIRLHVEMADLQSVVNDPSPHEAAGSPSRDYRTMPINMQAQYEAVASDAALVAALEKRSLPDMLREHQQLDDRYQSL